MRGRPGGVGRGRRQPCAWLVARPADCHTLLVCLAAHDVRVCPMHGRARVARLLPAACSCNARWRPASRPAVPCCPATQAAPWAGAASPSPPAACGGRPFLFLSSKNTALASPSRSAISRSEKRRRARRIGSLRVRRSAASTSSPTRPSTAGRAGGAAVTFPARPTGTQASRLVLQAVQSPRRELVVGGWRRHRICEHPAALLLAQVVLSGGAKAGRATNP